MAIAFAAATISQSIFTGLLTSGYSLYISWKLFLMMLIELPIAIPLASYFSTKAERPIPHQQAEMSKAAKHVNNALSSIETVKCFYGQDLEHEQYSLSLCLAAAFYKRQSFWSALQYGLFRLVPTGMFVVAFWFGEYLLRHGEITAKNLLITFMATMMAVSSLNAISPQIMILARGRIAAGRLRDIEDHSTLRNSGEEEWLPRTAYCGGGIDIACVGG
jgi:ATP-binding cassette subfamily B (MDR/TAP) protein 1